MPESKPKDLIFKIVPSPEWDLVGSDYEGSAHDLSDGFLHFSTLTQLPETLQLYYKGQRDLVLIAVDPVPLSAKLKYEFSASRGTSFPHLYGPLPRSAVLWVRPLSLDMEGRHVLPSFGPNL